MKIALIGSAPSSVRLAPYANKDWQIWGCSPGVYGVAPRVDAWFELHRYEPGQPWFSPEYCQFMAKFAGPVFMAEVRPEIPNSQTLPIQEMIAKYGPYFFTSSLSYMFALAINLIEAEREEQTKKGEPHSHSAIGLWGVDMAACTSGDARVLTADLQWVRADEVKVGDKLIGFDEHAQQQSANAVAQRRWRVSEVLEASRLTKPCYRLTLEDGRELICSDDHQWLTHAENECRWKMAKDMVSPHHRTDRPSRIVKLTDVWVEDRSWEAGYLAAAFDGEGHLSQKLRDGDNGVLRAGFAQRDNVMSESVLDAMKKRGFDLTIDSGGDVDGDCRKYTVKGGRAENMRFLGSIRPRRLLDKFKSDDLGIVHKIGKIAVVKAEFIGDHPVVGLRTSTKTFVCEGLASHNTEEYGYQRAGCQFFAMIAKSKWIEVGVPPESDLLRPAPLYGISEVDHARIKITARRRELQQRLASAQNQAEQFRTETMFLQGALDDLNWAENTWTGDTVSRTYVEPPLVPALNNIICNPVHGKKETVFETNGVLGIVDEPSVFSRFKRRKKKA